MDDIQRKLISKVQVAAQIIHESGRRSGASHIVTSRAIYDTLFPEINIKRLEKMNRIMNGN